MRIKHAEKASRRSRTRDILLTLFSYLFAVGMIGTAKAEYPITDTTRALDTVKLMLAAEARGDQRALEELLAEEHLRISPDGDVETRSDIVGSLAGAQNKEGAKLADHADTTLSEVAFEETKAGVIIVALQDSTRQPIVDGRNASLRVTFLLEKRQGRWVILLAHYTPLGGAGS
ncbi:DUF4440 domain-containing protein [Pseudoxanthomonas mexicana]